MSFDALIRLVDSLEDRADGYVTLDELPAAEDVQAAIAEHILLVDYRSRADGSPVTLCRLNRRHPKVVALTAW